MLGKREEIGEQLPNLAKKWILNRLFRYTIPMAYMIHCSYTERKIKKMCFRIQDKQKDWRFFLGELMNINSLKEIT